MEPTPGQEGAGRGGEEGKEGKGGRQEGGRKEGATSVQGKKVRCFSSFNTQTSLEASNEVGTNRPRRE